MKTIGGDNIGRLTVEYQWHTHKEPLFYQTAKTDYISRFTVQFIIILGLGRLIPTIFWSTFIN